MPLSAAEKQRNYRERLKSSMTEAEYAEKKKKRAEYEHLRVQKNKLWARIQDQFDVWLRDLKRCIELSQTGKDWALCAAPIFVPDTPFYTSVVKKANLTTAIELRLWQTIFSGLSIWACVSASEISLQYTGAYGSRSELNSTLEKLSSAGIVTVTKDENGILNFRRGENWLNSPEFDRCFE